LIGGTTGGAPNVIVSNGPNAGGISIASAGNTVQGNLIGTNAAGTAIPVGTPGTTFAGVWIDGSGKTIGGTTAGAGNLISGHRKAVILDRGAQNNMVQGNLIGGNIQIHKSP
jgi:hypothetical protein